MAFTDNFKIVMKSILYWTEKNRTIELYKKQILNWISVA